MVIITPLGLAEDHRTIETKEDTLGNEGNVLPQCDAFDTVQEARSFAREKLFQNISDEYREKHYNRVFPEPIFRRSGGLVYRLNYDGWSSEWGGKGPFPATGANWDECGLHLQGVLQEYSINISYAEVQKWARLEDNFTADEISSTLRTVERNNFQPENPNSPYIKSIQKQEPAWRVQDKDVREEGHLELILISAVDGDVLATQYHQPNSLGVVLNPPSVNQTDNESQDSTNRTDSEGEEAPSLTNHPSNITVTESSRKKGIFEKFFDRLFDLLSRLFQLL
ncbi:MAG: hypothetical protein U5J64_07890 [Halobacteriales archaeon]|nr:hypothetical protein [Halobacteriales archaeon]